jgi:hypothetical protein
VIPDGSEHFERRRAEWNQQRNQRRYRGLITHLRSPPQRLVCQQAGLRAYERAMLVTRGGRLPMRQHSGAIDRS